MEDDLRRRNLERKSSFENLGLIWDLESLMMKMDFENDFEHKEGWGMIFVNQFDVKNG